MLVSLDQLEKEINQPFSSYAKADKEDLFLAEEAEIKPSEKPIIKEITKGNVIGSEENLEKRREMILAKGFEPAEFAFERAIGKNDSLYTNFTELIALTKRKVGRIVVKEKNKKIGYATGFMVSDELMLTNWHVFKNPEMAFESEVQFFYEYNTQGHPIAPAIFNFDTSKFFNNRDLDYCFVRVQPTDRTGKIPLKSIGYLYLDKTLGKIGEINEEKLNIIHHPQGDFKQISIRENLFVGIDETKIFYATDTAQGSSGSPVFNDQWQVVGLHHKSVPKLSANGLDYLDDNDRVIPIIDGKIDISRIVWLKNVGIRISVILKHLLEENKNNEIVAGLALPPPKEDLSFTIKSAGEVFESENENNMANDKNITINVPTAALSLEKSIEISLASKAIEKVSTQIKTETTTNSQTALDEALFEIAKAEREQNTDFSECLGYDADFLGVNVLLPQPNEVLEPQIARLKNNSIELKYFKYSVIFNAVTRMPAISAVNVEGDASKRLDDSKRRDNWLRDKRIDIECQLTDKFYSRSKFDKGHMSRFEDANWDNTEEDALRNGIYTTFYTNACPQVVALNRGGGLWGKLEKQLLEKGIKKESGKKARMTVFNGPIFDDNKDRIFKGVKIPMEYYKIILWINDENKLKATGFKLTQELLVNHIKFDESMRIDEEALDIDKVVVFKDYQCSMKKLTELTNVDFSGLEQFDTFAADNNDNEIILGNFEEIFLS